MEQIINELISILFNNFDICFMLIVNILTYLIIKFIDQINGDKPVPTWLKRLVLIVCVVVCTIGYGFGGKFNSQLINSAIAAPIFYSWILKPILKKFGINYSTLDDYLSLKE